MTPLSRLGGFKVLKDVVGLTLLSRPGQDGFPLRICRAVAQQKVNMPYVTCCHDGRAWGLNLAVEKKDAETVSSIMDGTLEERVVKNAQSAILSLFPHKSNPQVPGILYEIFGREKAGPEAIANSPSAISFVLREEDLNQISSALFGPFQFSAYRTPEDWKLAQKGKEQLYKEVVASYQEKRPKVYALECIENQFFIHVRIQSRDRSQFGRTLKGFADAGLNITFLSSSPVQESEEENIIFCLPDSPGIDHRAVIARESPDVRIERMDQAAVFAMNGPHFGDRYGIASELLTAFEEKAIHPTGLNCTVASITGSVPIAQMDETIRTIEACFEVPSVIRK